MTPSTALRSLGPLRPAVHDEPSSTVARLALSLSKGRKPCVQGHLSRLAPTPGDTRGLGADE
jgi:hypothetical protein